jgi:hypothetical protein
MGQHHEQMDIPRSFRQGKIMGIFVAKINNTKIDLNNSNSRSNHLSYDPRQSKHIFTKIKINEPKPTDNIWICTSHVFLPTFRCQKCNIWSSHHDQLHDEWIRWQNNKNAQMVKMDEQHKQTKQNHYGPPHQSSFNHYDNNKRPNSNSNRDMYQDKRPRNDRARSNSRDRSNSKPRSQHSPGGDNHRNCPYFYDEKKKYLNIHDALYAEPHTIS